MYLKEGLIPFKSRADTIIWINPEKVDAVTPTRYYLTNEQIAEFCYIWVSGKAYEVKLPIEDIIKELTDG